MSPKHPTYEHLIFSALSDLYHQHHSPNVHINSLYNYFSRNYVQPHHLSQRSWKSLVRKRIDSMAIQKVILKIPKNYIRIISKRHFQGHTTQGSRQRTAVLPSPPATSPMRSYTPPTPSLKQTPPSAPEAENESSPLQEIDNSATIELIKSQKETLKALKREFLNALNEDYSFQEDIQLLRQLFMKHFQKHTYDQALLLSDAHSEINYLETEKDKLLHDLNYYKALSKWQDAHIDKLTKQLSDLKQQISELHKLSRQ